MKATGTSKDASMGAPDMEKQARVMTGLAVTLVALGIFTLSLLGYVCHQSWVAFRIKPNLIVQSKDANGSTETKEERRSTGDGSGGLRPLVLVDRNRK